MWLTYLCLCHLKKLNCYDILRITEKIKTVEPVKSGKYLILDATLWDLVCQ